MHFLKRGQKSEGCECAESDRQAKCRMNSNIVIQIAFRTLKVYGSKCSDLLRLFPLLKHATKDVGHILNVGLIMASGTSCHLKHLEIKFR